MCSGTCQALTTGRDWETGKWDTCTEKEPPKNLSKQTRYTWAQNKQAWELQHNRPMAQLNLCADCPMSASGDSEWQVQNLQQTSELQLRSPLIDAVHWDCHLSVHQCVCPTGPVLHLAWIVLASVTSLASASSNSPLGSRITYLTVCGDSVSTPGFCFQ